MKFQISENKIICESDQIYLLGLEGHMKTALEQLIQENYDRNAYLRSPIINMPQGWTSIIAFRYSPPIEAVSEKRGDSDYLTIAGLNKTKVEEELQKVVNETDFVAIYPSRYFMDYCRYQIEQRQIVLQEVRRCAREEGIDVKTTYAIKMLAGVLHFGFRMDIPSALKTAEQRYASSN